METGEGFNYGIIEARSIDWHIVMRYPVVLGTGIKGVWAGFKKGKACSLTGAKSICCGRFTDLSKNHL